MSSSPEHPDLALASVSVETARGTVEIVRARGAVDMLTGSELERSLELALDRQPSAIIADLTDVDFLASFGMAVLVRTSERLPRTIRFAVVADGPATSRPLVIIGLDEVLAIYPTLATALDSLRVGDDHVHA